MGRKTVESYFRKMFSPLFGIYSYKNLKRRPSIYLDEGEEHDSALELRIILYVQTFLKIRWEKVSF